MLDDTTEAWLRIALAPGLETLSLIRMLREVGCVEELVRADYAQLARVAGDDQARALTRVDEDQFNRGKRWLLERPDAFLISVIDPEYPTVLIETGLAPVVLFGLGNRSLIRGTALWVTGTSCPEEEALSNAFEFGRVLAERRFLVTSGLMPGIEMSVAEAYLKAEAPLLVWAATGLDRAYPKVSLKSFHGVLQSGGLILSANAPGEPVSRLSLMQRRALLAAYSRGVLVVADERHGDAVEAGKMAAQFGRDVFAVPGSIHSVGSKGPHQLIREGAKLVESVLDLLDEW